MAPKPLPIGRPFWAVGVSFDIPGINQYNWYQSVMQKAKTIQDIQTRFALSQTAL